MRNEKNCPVCNSENTIPFLIRNNMPFHQNFIIDDKEEAINMPRGNLTLNICTECSFIYNSAFNKNNIAYNDKYDNVQDLSPFFLDYIDQEIAYLINEWDVRNKNIVEVGCGKGTFLKRLVSASNSRGYGFDPSYVGKKVELDGKAIFEKNFYDESCTDLPTDFVICRHVIEHVPDPILLLKNIKKALKNKSDTLVFFETPNVEWILDNKVIFDFFYEHCSYFNKNSIIKVFEKSGFDVQVVNYEFKDQYMWIIAKVKDEKYSDYYDSLDIPKIIKKAKIFANEERKIISKWKNNITSLLADGKGAIWGAGAKGTTFVNLIDSSVELIDCIIDINENKQGKYVAGTGHPIVSYKEIPNRKIKFVIIMNSNYFEEIKKLLSDDNININLIVWEA